MQRRLIVPIDRRAILAGLGAVLLTSTQRAQAAPFPSVKSYRNPGCGCCEKWSQAMSSAGFTITMEDHADLDGFKAQLGIPSDLAGCHTALVGEYVIEGHVPPDDVIYFLMEKTEAAGLAVPGMPMGSAGMEMDGMKDAYNVIQFGKDETRKIFARHS